MIYTYTGENSFLRSRSLVEKIRTFTETYGDFALERLRGDEATVEQIQAALTSVPFLAERKLVVIYNASANKDFADVAATIIQQVPDTTDVIFDESKLDKRTSYYKWAKSKTEFQEFTTLDDQRLTAWMVEYAKQKGSTLARADAGYLLRRVGNNQMQLANELDKLSLLDGPITKVRIDDLTEPTPQSKIFDLLDAAFSGNTIRAMELYDDQRAQKVEPQQILAMLGWQLRQVALAKTAGKHDLVREGKMSPYGADNARRIANRMTLSQLKRLISELAELDARSKRSALDLDQALRAYTLRITE